MVSSLGNPLLHQTKTPPWKFTNAVLVASDHMTAQSAVGHAGWQIRGDYKTADQVYHRVKQFANLLGYCASQEA